MNRGIRNPIKRRTFIRFSVLLVAMTMVAAACGSDSADTTTTTAPPAATTTAPPAATTTAPPAATTTTQPGATTTTVITSDEEPEVSFGFFAGSTREDITASCLIPFEAATGIKVTYIDSFFGLGSIRAQVESGTSEADLAAMNGIEIAKAVEGDFLQPLNYDFIDTSQMSPNQHAPGHDYGDFGITNDIYAPAMAYDANQWPDPASAPSSWEDFWDLDAFPGIRSMEASRPLFNTPAASRSLGIPAAETYPMDFEAMLSRLDEIKSDIVFYESFTQSAQFMVAGEVDIIFASTGRIQEANDAGANFVIVPETYIRNSGTNFVVPANAEHPKNAALLASFCASIGPSAAFANLRRLPPSNLLAFDLLDADLKEIVATAPQFEDTTVVISDEWYGTRIDEIENRWIEWLAE